MKEGPYNVLDLSARTAVMQRGPLVERITADRITPAPPPVDETETHKYAAALADFAVKKLDGEALLLEGML